jgi:ribosomal protein S1
LTQADLPTIICTRGQCAAELSLRRSRENVGQELSTPNIPPRKVVKTLAVGQEVEGIVKRVTEFGAFIDIGVGRDGLVRLRDVHRTGRESFRHRQ